MSNTRFFNPRRNGAWSGIGIDRAAARSNAMHFCCCGVHATTRRTSLPKLISDFYP
jgi:hypothetical protein